MASGRLGQGHHCGMTPFAKFALMLCMCITSGMERREKESRSLLAVMLVMVSKRSSMLFGFLRILSYCTQNVVSVFQMGGIGQYLTHTPRKTRSFLATSHASRHVRSSFQWALYKSGTLPQPGFRRNRWGLTYYLKAAVGVPSDSPYASFQRSRTDLGRISTGIRVSTRLGVSILG
jgi:hypothetical protein